MIIHQNKYQRAKVSGQVHQTTPMVTQPGIKINPLSSHTTPWLPANLPKFGLSERQEQEGSLSLSHSAVGEKFRPDMMDIQQHQQHHNEQLMHMQQYCDQQLQQLLGQHQHLSLTHAEEQTEILLITAILSAPLKI